MALDVYDQSRKLSDAVRLHYLASSDKKETNPLESDIARYFTQLDSLDPSQDKVLRLRGQLSKDSNLDFLVAKVRAKGEALNIHNHKYNWYVVSLNNPEFTGADLFQNHISTLPLGEGGYKVKYFTFGSTVVLLHDHAKEYLGEIVSNWDAYRTAAIIPKHVPILGFQLKQLKAKALSQSINDGVALDNLVDNYARQFIHCQEALRVGSPFAPDLLDAYVSLYHLISTDNAFRYLVLADILEKSSALKDKKLERFTLGLSHKAIARKKNIADCPDDISNIALTQLAKLDSENKRRLSIVKRTDS
jgi:hypothetical protein